MPHKNNRLAYIIGTGLLAGTLDGLSAIIYNWKIKAATIFKFIASGFFGKATAFTGGAGMVLWGIFFHYLIAITFTTVLFMLHPIIYARPRNRFLTGIVYGVFIWAVMNLVVVPLSKIPARPFHLTNSLTDCGILIICIGLPVSIIATRYYQHRSG